MLEIFGRGKKTGSLNQQRSHPLGFFLLGANAKSCSWRHNAHSVAGGCQRAIATECNRILFGNSKKAAKSDRRVLMCIVQQSQEQASVRKLGWMVKPGSRRDDLKTR
jgi:hypothetical protein